MAERKTMNVSMAPKHKAFIRAQVASGRYRNDSEVVRAGLRLLEAQARRDRLEELLVEGLESGEPVAMDEQYWADLRRRVAEQASRMDRGDA